MHQADYIDLIKSKYELERDSDVAKLLKVKPNSVSRYRDGTQQFGPETALIVAELLEIEPWRISADMMAARSKDSKTKKAWMKYGGILTVTLITALGLTPYTINDVSSTDQPDTVYIMRSL